MPSCVSVLRLVTNLMGNHFETAKNGCELARSGGESGGERQEAWTDEKLWKEYPAILESMGRYTFNFNPLIYYLLHKYFNSLSSTFNEAIEGTLGGRDFHLYNI